MRPPPQSATDSEITRRIGKKTPRSANPLQFSESGGGRRMPGKSGGRPKKGGEGMPGLQLDAGDDLAVLRLVDGHEAHAGEELLGAALAGLVDDVDAVHAA